MRMQIKPKGKREDLILGLAEKLGISREQIRALQKQAEQVIRWEVSERFTGVVA